ANPGVGGGPGGGGGGGGPPGPGGGGGGGRNRGGWGGGGGRGGRRGGGGGGRRSRCRLRGGRWGRPGCRGRNWCRRGMRPSLNAGGARCPDAPRRDDAGGHPTRGDQQQCRGERQTTLAQVHAFPLPPAGILLRTGYRP